MKRLVFLAVCFLCLKVAGQEKVHPLISSSTAWSFGLKAGRNSSFIKSDLQDYESIFPRTSFYGGFLFNKPFRGNFSFQSGLVISPHGYKFRFNPPDSVSFTKFGSTIILRYLNLPLLLQYTSVKGFFGFAGPQASLYLGGNEFAGPQASLYLGGNENTESKSAICATAGGGYILRNGLGVDASYSISLNLIESGIPGPNLYTHSTIRGRTHLFQAGAIYYFAIAKKRPKHS